MIPKAFSDWACSLSGCDGGNLNAETWVCGIEWGQGSYEDGKYYLTELPQEIAKGEYSGYSDSYDWAGSLRYPYGRSFAKLYAAIYRQDLGTYRDFVSTLNGSEVFKLNLYPIAFDSTDAALWRKYKLRDLTGFSEKHLFQTWCFYNRFPAIAQLALKHQPRIIIGTGGSYFRDFFECFGGSKDAVPAIKYDEIAPKSESNQRSRRRYYWVPISQHTTLFVIPFFSGSHGLNSNYLLQEMGERIYTHSQ